MWLPQTIPESSRPSFDSQQETPPNSLPSAGLLAATGLPPREEHVRTGTFSSLHHSSSSSSSVNGVKSHSEEGYAVSGAHESGPGFVLQPLAQVVPRLPCQQRVPL